MVRRAGLYLGLAALCLVSSAIGGAVASFVILGAVLPSTSEQPEPPREDPPSAGTGDEPSTGPGPSTTPGQAGPGDEQKAPP